MYLCAGLKNNTGADGSCSVSGRDKYWPFSLAMAVPIPVGAGSVDYPQAGNTASGQ